jgi:hypothetical protein
LGGNLLLIATSAVIQWINSFEYAKDNLADLLAGRPPTSPSDDPVGTHNYGQLPRAIIFGRAFPHEQAKELNRLFRGSSAKPVAWIVGDPDVVPPAHPGPDYAAKGAAHVKAAFSKWNASGGNTDDILYY